LKQRLENGSQFILREVAIREFSDAQFDLANDLAQRRIRLHVQVPGFDIEPIAKLGQRNLAGVPVTP
jgi:hypothetical protein